MYFIVNKRMSEVCFLVHPDIRNRTFLSRGPLAWPMAIVGVKNVCSERCQQLAC